MLGLDLVCVVGVIAQNIKVQYPCTTKTFPKTHQISKYVYQVHCRFHLWTYCHATIIYIPVPGPNGI